MRMRGLVIAQDELPLENTQIFSLHELPQEVELEVVPLPLETEPLVSAPQAEDFEVLRGLGRDGMRRREREESADVSADISHQGIAQSL
jgi:hypothetical protein